MGKCQFYTPHMETLLKYCNALYSLKGCGSGGLLHILLDDDNIDDESICYCLKECLLHPEKEESALGILICHEYLKMPIEDRMIFDELWCGWDGECENYPVVHRCVDCYHIEPVMKKEVLSDESRS